NGDNQMQTQYTQDWFVYVANFGNIGGGSGLTFAQNVQIQADSDFELVEITAQGLLHALLGVAGTPIVGSNVIPASMQITDSGSGRSLFSAPVPVNMVAGTGQFPFILPVPRICKALSNIQVSLTMFDTTTYDSTFVAFIGRKIFALG